MTSESSSSSKKTYNSSAIGRHKRFSSILGMWDTISRGRMRAVFGDTIKDCPDPYGVDFLITDKNCRYTQLEIQVVKKWKEGGEYPYPNITLFTRKGRYDDKTLFCSINRQLTECYLFYLSDEDRKNPTRLFPDSEEYVYNISWPHCMKLYLHTVTGSILASLYPNKN
jgi:hypothetical protein